MFLLLLQANIYTYMCKNVCVFAYDQELEYISNCVYVCVSVC